MPDQDTSTSRTNPPRRRARVASWFQAIVISLTLATGLMQAGCSPDPGSGLRIGTNIWPGYEPLYLARSLGWLSNSGIRLVEYPASTETMRALRDGSIEAGALTMDEALTLMQEGVDLYVVLLLDVSHGADAVLTQPGIPLDAMAGKRIGVEASAVGGYMLDRMLDHFDLNLADIHIVPLSADRHEAAFLNHNIDAVVTFEPVKSRLVAQGAQVVFDSSQIPGEIMDVLVVRADALPENRQAIARIAEKWFAALTYMQEHRDDALAHMQPRLKLQAQELSAIYQGLHMGSPELNRAFFSSNSQNSIEKISHMMRAMLKNGLLRHEMDIRPMFTAGMAAAGFNEP